MTKIEIIRTYDQSQFKRKLEEMYQTHNVIRVDTHTETSSERNAFVIWYIAIVFYKDNEDYYYEDYESDDI